MSSLSTPIGALSDRRASHLLSRIENSFGENQKKLFQKILILERDNETFTEFPEIIISMNGKLLYFQNEIQ